LTATLPAEIGDFEVLARTIEFEFLRPVYAGDAVRCEWTTERVDERPDRYDLAAAIDCRCTASAREGAVEGRVLRGRVEGLVWRDD
jgi:acyl dehydratase